MTKYYDTIKNANRDQSKKYEIKWQKYPNFPSYSPEVEKCCLCMNEKVEIALHKGHHLLNKRNEIISRCRHRSKYKLKNLTPSNIK